MTEISRELLLHVAHLARLELREDELARLEGQLNDILAAVSKVAELDLSDVPPTSHPLQIANAWAEDEPHACLSLDDVFANVCHSSADQKSSVIRKPPRCRYSRRRVVSSSLKLHQPVCVA